MNQYCDDENKISPNDETIEICINDVSIEDRSKESPNVQTKGKKLNIIRIHSFSNQKY